MNYRSAARSEISCLSANSTKTLCQLARCEILAFGDRLLLVNITGSSLLTWTLGKVLIEITKELQDKSSGKLETSKSAGTGPTEGQIKGKYLAMTLMDLRRECTQKGLSEIGSKDQIIARLVEKETSEGRRGGAEL